MGRACASAGAVSPPLGPHRRGTPQRIDGSGMWRMAGGEVWPKRLAKGSARRRRATLKAKRGQRSAGVDKAYEDLFKTIHPGGCAVRVGLPVDPAPFDVIAAMAKEARSETLFRCANAFDRSLALMSSGRTEVKRLIAGRSSSAGHIAAFESAGPVRASDVGCGYGLPATDHERDEAAVERPAGCQRKGESEA